MEEEEEEEAERVEGDGVRKGRKSLKGGTLGLPRLAKYIRNDGERPDHR